MKKIIFTVTTDLSYDQRMMRICTSLSFAGYDVLLVGRKTKKLYRSYRNAFCPKKIELFFVKGKVFYAEYNIRLFFYLLFSKMDAICAIDLDTILPCYYISKLKKVKRVYDAHELFCEMKEVITRPKIYRFWKWIERRTVPYFTNGYTVNMPIATEYERMYGCRYKVIRNVPKYNAEADLDQKEKYVLYQGAVNEGRSFETIIPAMQHVNGTLIICGDGNFMSQAKALVQQYNLENKIRFTGMLQPDALKEITLKAYAGLNIIEPHGLSYYLSLANRFFDYIHAAVPQVCVGYPAYKALNDEYEIAVLIDDISAENIAVQLNKLITDKILWQQLRDHCKVAAKELCWENEEKILIDFYKNLFG